ncbi:cation:dicarboxylate symporter family transporter [Caulobacter segnis]
MPDTFVGAFAEGKLPQVAGGCDPDGLRLRAAGRFRRQGPRGGVLEDTAKLFFGVIHVVVRLAPLGAFGAMGFTIGKYGVERLMQLGALVATAYVTSILFVLVVLEDDRLGQRLLRSCASWPISARNS